LTPANGMPPCPSTMSVAASAAVASTIDGSASRARRPGHCSIAAILATEHRG
jgi:hypothetical protein